MEEIKFPEGDCHFENVVTYEAEGVDAWFKRCMADHPVCEEWNQFTEDMKGADVWYDVLDSPEEGKILDYLYEIMAWKKKWFSQFR